jgi:hypothetical protein
LAYKIKGDLEAVNLLSTNVSVGNSLLPVSAGYPGQVLTNKGDGTTFWESPLPYNFLKGYMRIEDRTQPSGTFTSGAWRIRALTNTLHNSIGNDATVDFTNNRFTLPAGLYQVKIVCPAFSVEDHQARLWNFTAGSIAIPGTTNHARPNTSVDSGSNSSFISGEIFHTTPTTYRVEHRCSTSTTTNGFGWSPSIATWSSNPPTSTVNTVVELWKIPEFEEINMQLLTSIDYTTATVTVPDFVRETDIGFMLEMHSGGSSNTLSSGWTRIELFIIGSYRMSLSYKRLTPSDRGTSISGLQGGVTRNQLLIFRNMSNKALNTTVTVGNSDTFTDTGITSETISASPPTVNGQNEAAIVVYYNYNDFVSTPKIISDTNMILNYSSVNNFHASAYLVCNGESPTNQTVGAIIDNSSASFLQGLFWVKVTS